MPLMRPDWKRQAKGEEWAWGSSARLPARKFGRESKGNAVMQHILKERGENTVTPNCTNSLNSGDVVGANDIIAS